uniref:non-specific serine/threonine protein kinase n=1 Tax=Globodera pallida TaxID=36090 RepID=A0A183CFT2_GLOPA
MPDDGPSTAFSADSFTTRTKADFLFLSELGEERQTSRKFAVKICLKKKIMQEKKVQQIFRERDALRLLSTPANASPFVVRLFCTFQDRESLYFVLSLAEKRDLLARLKALRRFSVRQCQFAMAELLLALEHIHALGVIHRDVKPENILLREDGHILLSDFGCAKQKQSVEHGAEVEHGKEEQMTSTDKEQKRALKRRCSFVGTGAYVSPEVLNGEEVTGACDWWAFGVILFELLAGRRPFSGASEYFLFRQVLALSYEFPDDFPCDSSRQLVQALLVLVPAQRMGSDAMGGAVPIRHHPFYNSTDWDSIGKRKSPLFDSSDEPTDGEEGGE